MGEAEGACYRVRGAGAGEGRGKGADEDRGAVGEGVAGAGVGAGGGGEQDGVAAGVVGYVCRAHFGGRSGVLLAVGGWHGFKGRVCGRRSLD